MSRFSSRLLACDDALSINEWLEFSQSGHEEFSAAICWVTPTDATTILESPRPDNRLTFQSLYRNINSKGA